MGGLGWQELTIILVIVIIIFGAGKLPEIGGALYVASGFLLSFVISMLAFVFPSGLGVREGIFALALAHHLPGSVAIAAAAVARLVPTLVEIAFAAAIVALDRERRRRRSR
jgi:TatA/E family protein of Tat protein translocase